MTKDEIFQHHLSLIKGKMIMYECTVDRLDNRMIIKRGLVVGIDLNQSTNDIRAYFIKDDFNVEHQVNADAFLGFMN